MSGVPPRVSANGLGGRRMQSQNARTVALLTGASPGTSEAVARKLIEDGLTAAARRIEPI